MNQPEFQAVWSKLNAAMVALINAADAEDRDQLLECLTVSQANAKGADSLLKQIMARKPGKDAAGVNIPR